MRPKIIIADSELDYLPNVRTGILAGCHFVRAASEDDVMTEMHAAPGACLLLIDSGRTEDSSSKLLRRIKEKGRRSSKVVCTAENPTVELVIAAFKDGACDFIPKPASHSEVLSTVQALVHSAERMPSYWARRLDAYLIDNLSNPDLNLAFLQTHFAVSKSYLSKLFRSEIGVPFRDRLMRFRMLKAAKLIETTDHPIYLVSYHCGFRSQCRLTEAFTRYHGLGPRRYREAHRSQFSRSN